MKNFDSEKKIRKRILDERYPTVSTPIDSVRDRQRGKSSATVTVCGKSSFAAVLHGKSIIFAILFALKV